MVKTKMEKIKRYKGKKLRFPIIEEVDKGMSSDQSDVGAEMPNSSDGVHHLRRTEPKEIHHLTHSEIEGVVGDSKVKTHPDTRVEEVKVRNGVKKHGFVQNNVGVGAQQPLFTEDKHDDVDDENNDSDDWCLAKYLNHRN